MATLDTAFKTACHWEALSPSARAGLQRLGLTTVTVYRKCVGGAWDEFVDLVGEIDGDGR